MIGKLVVNFLGPPSSGKTVAATSLFNKLKKRHMDCVLIPEFAAMKAIEENKRAFQNQFFIIGNQQYQIFCGYHHAKVVVTDSPILLGAIYNVDSPAFCQVIINEHHKYNNLNILMELDDSFPYSMVGRVHSMTESVSLGKQIVNLLELEDIPFIRYNEFEEDDIVDLIIESVE